MEQADSVQSQLTNPSQLKPGDDVRLRGEAEKLRREQESLAMQVKLLQQKQERLTILSPIDGEISTWQIRERLLYRPIQIGQLLMTVVEPNGPWELELHMPEGNMGFVSEAQAELGPKLPVEYVTMTNPGATHEGTVSRVHRTAEVRPEEGNTVLIRVDINKDDVPERRPGADVTAQVYCGRSSLGYSWFHSLVSWFQKTTFKYL
jgi:multidrug efflux pump subunit AcrA (membrane-fusion protein)